MADIIVKGRSKAPAGTMEDFQRPSHPDFLDSSELKKMEFSGIRENSITSEVEIWTVGDLRFHMSKALAEQKPEIFAEAYGRIFQIDVALVNIPGRG